LFDAPVGTGQCVDAGPAVDHAHDVLTCPVVLAGHGATRAGAGEALIRFSERLGLPVATTFHGKGVFPDDHPNVLGAVGFMHHDYVNFGFDEADVIISVGYELQEFDPIRINPEGDKRILHQTLPIEGTSIAIDGSRLAMCFSCTICCPISMPNATLRSPCLEPIEAARPAAIMPLNCSHFSN